MTSQYDLGYEENIIGDVKRFIDRIQREKKPWCEKWSTYWRYFENRHWKSEERRKSRTTVNYITPIIRSEIALLLDNRPRPQVVPEDGVEYEIFATVMESLIEHVCNEGDLEGNIEMQMTFMEIFGRGLLKHGYDAWNDRLYFYAPDSRNFFASPLARTVQESRYAVEVYPMDIDEIRERYPETGWAVKPSRAGREFELQRYDSDDLKIVYDVDRANRDSIEDNPPEFGDYYDNQTAWVWEIWTMGDPDYPKRRCTVYAAGVVLKDGHNPEEHGLYPYVDIPNFRLNRFWTLSSVEFLLSVQKQMNRAKNMIADTMNVQGNPRIVYDDGAIDENTITNAPGAFIPKRPGSEVRFEPGTPLPPQYFMHTADLKADMNFIAQQFDPVMGKGGGGVRSWGGVEALQDASLTKIRSKERALYRMLQLLGSMILSNISQYFTEPFRFRVQLDDGQWDYVDYDPDYAKYRYNVLIGAAPNLPISRYARSIQSMQLYAMRAIDQEALLKSLDYPGREGVLRRMQQQRAMESLGIMGGGGGGQGSTRPAPSASIKGGRSNLPLMTSRRTMMPQQVGL